jgi:hypothetical protein
MPPTFAQGQSQGYMGRQLYSPSMNFPNRNANSPSAGEGLPPPPYDINLPSFPTMSGGPPQSLPQLAPSQQQQQQQQNKRNNRLNSKINSRLHHSRTNPLNINSS